MSCWRASTEIPISEMQAKLEAKRMMQVNAERVSELMRGRATNDWCRSSLDARR